MSEPHIVSDTSCVNYDVYRQSLDHEYWRMIDLEVMDWKGIN